MKVSCDVIQDLLPLYTDQAASADTVALVEEHLASCPACREELGRLGTALPAGARRGWEPLRRFKRRWRRRQVLIAVTAAVVTAAVAGGIFLTCFWGRRVAAEDVEVSLELQWSGLTSGEDSGGDGSRGELEQGNWSGVIHVCSSHEKNLRSRIEPFSETDENGVIVRAGYVIDMWEVPDRAPSGSGSITAGYGYPNEAGPIPEDFDIVFIVATGWRSHLLRPGDGTTGPGGVRKTCGSRRRRGLSTPLFPVIMEATIFRSGGIGP